MMSGTNATDSFTFSEFIKDKVIPKKRRAALWKILHEQGLSAALDAANLIEVVAVDYLRDAPLPYPVWGREGIEQSAIDQMNTAMSLPVSVAGALNADAHQGYGLPIGGVLAVDNAVIPYGIGVDISCQIRLSIFPIDAEFIDDEQFHSGLQSLLIQNTRFGIGCVWEKPLDDPVLENDLWKFLPIELNGLRLKAMEQLSTSGGGNHFVEFGTFKAQSDSPLSLGLSNHESDGEDHTYLALMSHSGSRGVGAKIADYYSKLAMSMHPSLPTEAKHLAWLDLDHDSGREYWQAMELAGQFADANHVHIHKRIASALGTWPIMSIMNKHNYAWNELVTLPNGDMVEAVVHRKGATPAYQDQFGIIPGTMAEPAYMVTGKGNAESLNSASHGAGRAMSRTQAKKNISRKDMDKFLKTNNVELIGGDLDEAPQAYKRISDVMAAQSDLVDITGTFTPRIVRMADDGKAED